MKTFLARFFVSQVWFALALNLFFTALAFGFLLVASQKTDGYPVAELPRLVAGVALFYTAVMAGITYRNSYDIFAMLLVCAIGAIGTFIVPVPPPVLIIGGCIACTLMVMWNLEQFPEKRSIYTRAFIFFPAGAILGSLYLWNETAAIVVSSMLLLVQAIFALVTFAMEDAVSRA